ncbi:Uncharacterised protein [Mycobacteroides abscessus subsp. abscessus]|nr:Uncharacterised protein [Mycobacteroides abscessus subsp. abscessus]
MAGSTSAAGLGPLRRYLPSRCAGKVPVTSRSTLSISC